MTTAMSSIPNIQRFSRFLGTSSFQHSFFQVKLSSIMATTISMFTSSVDSPIHSYVSSLSSAQIITTCQYDIPFVYITLLEKKDFSICDYFTSLAFTSISFRMNIASVSMDISLNQTQSDSLVSVHSKAVHLLKLSHILEKMQLYPLANIIGVKSIKLWLKGEPRDPEKVRA